MICPLCNKKKYKRYTISFFKHLNSIHNLNETEILDLLPIKLCGDGCGRRIRPNVFYINGHGSKETQFKKSFCSKTSFKKGQKTWNKGLTKETNKILKLAGEKHSITIKNNPRPNFKGKHHTTESIEKNRATNLKIKNTPENIEKGREIANRPEVKERTRQRCIKQHEEGILGWNLFGEESYPEKCYREFLESWGYVKNCCFFQNYQVGSYRLDFAFPEDKRYIEIDGSQHLKPDAIEHDIKRDAWLYEQGWIGLRIPIKDLYKFLKSLEAGATVVAGTGGVL